MKEGILTAISCLYFLSRVKMSETNQQRDELPAYLKDEPPAGTARYADVSWKWLATVIPFSQQLNFLS